MTIDPKNNPVVAALPGGGWMVEYKQVSGGVETYPVVGWLILADGQMIPMDANVDGSTQDARAAGNFERLYHPQMTGTGQG
ncbi:hypothetical protein [Streptomyces sp. CA-132043]|uniref:hypothetical protein n=1 Tax=Streptomyces sp. CA-132043 TaxID=3240048 RepID=UPI003D8F333D